MNWQVDYRRKIVPPQEAVHGIQSNMRVYIHPGCAGPEELVEALMARVPFVKNVEIVHLLTVGRADYIAPQMQGHFRHNAMFIGGNVRQAINEGRADYTPVFLSQVEDLFESEQMPIGPPLSADGDNNRHGDDKRER
jgi:4-hydroxybutyrate CoA-transferase